MSCNRENPALCPPQNIHLPSTNTTTPTTPLHAMGGQPQPAQAATARTIDEDFTLETATRNGEALFRKIFRKLSQEDRIAALEHFSFLMKSALKRVQPESRMEADPSRASTSDPPSAREAGNHPRSSAASAICQEIERRITPSRRNAERDVDHTASAPCSRPQDRRKKDACSPSEKFDPRARTHRVDAHDSTSSNVSDGMDRDDDMPRHRVGKRKRSETHGESIAQRGKRPQITSLDDLVGVLQDQDPIVIRRHAYQPFLVARDVIGEVLQQPEMANMKDEALAGVSLLAFIFGRDGCGQFRSLYKEHHKTHNHRDLNTAKLATVVVSDLKGLGCPTLSRLVDLWSKLESLGTGPKCKDMRRLKAHLEIVRIWESISLRDSNHTQELDKLRASPQFQDFLDQHGSRRKRGQTKQAQLTSFIAHKLSIPNRNFTNTASRYKPLLVLARYFGEGILAFLPRAGLLPLFNRLHLKAEGRHSKDKGELLFCAVIEKVLEKIPGITDLCSSAFSNLVEPILEESELPPTSGLRLLEAGEIAAFQSAEVWKLVTDEAASEGRMIEELSESSEASDIEGNAPAEIPVIKRGVVMSSTGIARALQR